MQIEALSPSVADSGAKTSSRPSTVDYDAFLKLLIATMRNQDPTQPNDPAEMLSQLASFSAVEQSIQTNSRLDALIRASAAGDAAALVGKTVESLDGLISGTVTAVEIAPDGLVAVTRDGSRLPLSSGYRILAT